MKIKVGPITAQYAGVARFVERDEAAGRAVLSAEGRDTRGAGNARATITATLTPDGAGTQVDVETDLDITGRVAQFGRGVLGDVSAKLMTEFAECLSRRLAADSPPGLQSDLGAEASSSPDGDPSPVAAPSASASKPVDLVRVVGGAVGRRVAPALGGGLLALFLLWRGRRKRRRRR